MKRIFKIFMDWLIGEEDFVSDIKRNYSGYDKNMLGRKLY